METQVNIEAQLATDYKRIRRQTEEICAPLKTEDFVVQPVVDVSPPKWHLAHTTWFFETFILNNFLTGYQVFHPKFGYLFNSYYESVGERVLRTDRGNLSRPTHEEIMAYRAHVDAHMEKLLSSLPEHKEESEIIRFLHVGLQHEQQHQELLLTDIKFILGHNPLKPAYKKSVHSNGVSKPGVQLKFIPVKGGLHTIGYEGHGFCWDNEMPSHQVYVNDFKLANRLVTNGEYLAFMESRGYSHFGHWLSDGWKMVQEQKWEAPMYWFKDGAKWYAYTLFGPEKINPADPVTHISFYEADAYASWCGKRLPTEPEWEAAARAYVKNPAEGNFANNDQLHPRMVTDGGEINQLMGDAWEWTYSGYFPYPGYRREQGALGEYNGKFMINQMVLRGGSCATPADHIRVTYRNFFQPWLRWQFTGIRLAE